MHSWRFSGILFLLLTSSAVRAQEPNYTGVWQGKFYDNVSFISNNDPYKFEVQIEHRGNSLLGVTYSYLNTTFYGKAAHNGFIRTGGKKILLTETRLLELRSVSNQACLMTCNMRYYKVGNDEFLEGTYTAVDKDNGSSCPGGYVKLKKVVRSDFRIEPNVSRRLEEIKRKAVTPKPVQPKIKTVNPPPVRKVTPPPTVKTNPPKKDTVKSRPVIRVVPPPKNDTLQKVVVTPQPAKTDTLVSKPPKPVVPLPPVLKERSNSLVQEIALPDTNQITVNLYDYGEVDGDIVSIFLDNEKVVSSQMLRVTPISIPIKVSAENPEHTLVMVAENLGSIPPNTALMVLYVRDQRYEIKIESTEQKNASVKFVYRPAK